MNKKIFSLAGIITIFTLAVFSTACSKKDTEVDALQAIKDRGVLRVAVFSDKPPFGYVDGSGKSQGYDIELAKRLAKDLLGDENKVKYVLTEAQHRVDVLKANKVDITLANFTITPQRAAQVDFAKPYMKTAIGIVSAKDKLITDITQLKDKILVVDKGTTAEQYFLKNHPTIKQIKFDHNSEAFAALTDGRGAGLANDESFLYAWIKDNKQFRVGLTGIGPVERIAPAVKKGNVVLLNWVNNEIGTLRKEEFFHTAFDKAVRPFYGDGVNPDNVVIDGSNSVDSDQ